MYGFSHSSKASPSMAHSKVARLSFAWNANGTVASPPASGFTPGGLTGRPFRDRRVEAGRVDDRPLPGGDARLLERELLVDEHADLEDVRAERQAVVGLARHARRGLAAVERAHVDELAALGGELEAGAAVATSSGRARTRSARPAACRRPPSSTRPESGRRCPRRPRRARAARAHRRSGRCRSWSASTAGRRGSPPPRRVRTRSGRRSGSSRRRRSRWCSRWPPPDRSSRTCPAAGRPSSGSSPASGPPGPAGRRRARAARASRPPGRGTGRARDRIRRPRRRARTRRSASGSFERKSKCATVLSVWRRRAGRDRRLGQEVDRPLELGRALVRDAVRAAGADAEEVLAFRELGVLVRRLAGAEGPLVERALEGRAGQVGREGEARVRLVAQLERRREDLRLGQRHVGRHLDRPLEAGRRRLDVQEPVRRLHLEACGCPRTRRGPPPARCTGGTPRRRRSTGR